MKHHFTQINVAHILQSLEASGALQRACRAQWAQQLALGIQASLERQIGVRSQVSDLAGSGQAADLLAMVYQLLNVDVLSTSLVALHSIPSPQHTAQSSHSTVPPWLVATTVQRFEVLRAKNHFLPWRQ